MLRGRLFARGFTYKYDQIKGIAIVSIDPETGAWQRLVDGGSGFSVSPDRQTIVFSKDDALWNGDAETNMNPGKIHGQEGSAVFAPDSRSMLVTIWTRNPDDPKKYEPNVVRMALDGTSPTPVAELAGYAVRDWSADGRWLLVLKDRTVHIMRPDGKESRQLFKNGEHPHFTPDGKRVVYVRGWTGALRVIDVDGTRDELFVQLPPLTYVLLPRFSPDGKRVAAVLQDQKLSQDGTPTIFADPKITHTRIVVFDTATGDQRVLTLPRQDDWDFYPTGELDWR